MFPLRYIHILRQALPFPTKETGKNFVLTSCVRHPDLRSWTHILDRPNVGGAEQVSAAFGVVKLGKETGKKHYERNDTHVRATFPEDIFATCCDATSALFLDLVTLAVATSDCCLDISFIEPIK